MNNIKFSLIPCSLKHTFIIGRHFIFPHDHVLAYIINGYPLTTLFVLRKIKHFCYFKKITKYAGGRRVTDGASLFPIAITDNLPCQYFSIIKYTFVHRTRVSINFFIIPHRMTKTTLCSKFINIYTVSVTFAKTNIKSKTFGNLLDFNIFETLYRVPKVNINRYNLL